MLAVLLAATAAVAAGQSCYTMPSPKTATASGETVALPTPLTVQAASAVMASTHHSDAWIYLFNAAGVKVGQIHGQPFQGSATYQLTAQPGQSLPIEVASYQVYSWWNPATISSLSFSCAEPAACHAQPAPVSMGTSGRVVTLERELVIDDAKAKMSSKHHSDAWVYFKNAAGAVVATLHAQPYQGTSTAVFAVADGYTLPVSVVSCEAYSWWNDASLDMLKLSCATPTANPTAAPTPSPSPTPTATPTAAPSAAPTAEPTETTSTTGTTMTTVTTATSTTHTATSTTHTATSTTRTATSTTTSTATTPSVTDGLACDRTVHFMLNQYARGRGEAAERYTESNLGPAQSQDHAEAMCLAMAERRGLGFGAFYVWHNHALQYGTRLNQVKCHVLLEAAAPSEFYRQFPAYGIVGAVCLPGAKAEAPDRRARRARGFWVRGRPL